MTKKCYLCREKPKSSCTRSFHKFPLNENMQKQWLKSLNLSSVPNLNTAYICSDHFKSTDYLDSEDQRQRRRLLSAAVPFLSSNERILKTCHKDEAEQNSATIAETYPLKQNSEECGHTINVDHERMSLFTSDDSVVSDEIYDNSLSNLQCKSGEIVGQHQKSEPFHLNIDNEAETSSVGDGLSNKEMSNLTTACTITKSKLPQGSTVDVPFEISKAKSNAQKCKEYREKIKLITPKEKKTPKSRAQINKNYYEKNKFVNNTSRSEYMKEYRRKKKLEKLQSKQIQRQQNDNSYQHSMSSTTSQHDDTPKKIIPPLPKAKIIIINVYEFFQAEYENLKFLTGGNCLFSPLADVVNRTAAATRVSEETVTAILEEISSEGSTHESVSSKSVRVTHDFEDEDVSPVEEESNGESADDAQQGDGESNIDIEEHPVQSVKVEIDVIEENVSEADHGILFQMQPLSTQQLSAIPQSLPPTSPTLVEVKQEPVDVEDHEQLPAIPQSLAPTAPTHVEVKQEPVDVEYHEQLDAGDAVKDIPSFEVPICESTSAVHHLLYSNFEATSEPTNHEYQGYSVDNVAATITKIKEEPYDDADVLKGTTVKSCIQSPKEYGKRKRANKVPKTNAERQQIFRQKQKNKRQSETLESILARLPSMMVQKTDDSHEKRKGQINESFGNEKIEEERNRRNREKCKRYREKCKRYSVKKMNEVTAPRISGPPDPDEEKREAERKQRNREKTKRYREKKKNEVATLPISGSSDTDEKKREERKQKNREKTKRYREKKKNEIKFAALSMATADSSTDSSGIKMKQARQKQISVEKLYNDLIVATVHVKAEPSYPAD